MIFLLLCCTKSCHLAIFVVFLKNKFLFSLKIEALQTKYIFKMIDM